MRPRNDARRAEIRKDRRAGLLVAEIAKKHGVAPSLVSYYCADMPNVRNKPCGTRAAYQRHKAHREIPCAPCDAAHKEYMHEYAQERKNNQKEAS